MIKYMLISTQQFCKERSTIMAWLQKKPTDITLKAAPLKTYYYLGETLEPDGGIITLIYKNGSSEDIAITAEMITGFDNSTYGDQVLSVTYQDLTVTFYVTVMPPKLAKPVVSACATVSSVRLEWAAIDDATSYRIFRTDPLNGNKCLLKVRTSPNYTDVTGEPGIEYS